MKNIFYEISRNRQFQSVKMVPGTPCLLAAYGLHWGIVGVYALLTTEEIFRLAVSLVIFKKRSWMISL